MAVIMGLANVPANSTAPVFFLPAGLAGCVMYQPTPATSTVYVGTTPNVSSTNGMPVPVTPLSFESYNTAKGTYYYATTGNATASTFCYLINTAN